MTIGNPLFKIICAVLCFSMLLCCVSCNRDGTDRDGAFDILDSLGEGDTSNQKATDHYRIVLSGSCSADVAQRARELEALIEQKTQIDCSVVFDTDQIAARDDVIEILVGNTNRNATALALEDIKARDYVIDVVDESIIIGGFSDLATLEALDRFISDIVPAATPARLMSGDQRTSYTHSYELDGVRLCGFSLSDFCIAYGKKSDHAANAKLIADTVAAKSGEIVYTLASDRALGRKEIALLTDESLEYGKAMVYVDEEDVVISANNSLGIAYATEYFVNAVLSNVAEGYATLDIKAPISITYSNDALLSDYRVIVSALCSSELTARARELSQLIEQKTGKKCHFCFDADVPTDNGGTLDIYVGDTNSSHTKAIFASMKRDDYVCKRYERVIVLGGHSDTATLDAIERFINEILVSSNAECLMSIDDGFSYEHTYALEGIELCGFKITDYTVSYPKNSPHNERLIAVSLLSAIADRSGEVLEYAMGNAVVGKKEIVLRVDPEAKPFIATISAVDEDVIISADTGEGLEAALQRIIELIDANSNGSASKIILDEAISFEYAQAPKPADIYRIILRGNCSADLVSAARELARLVEEKTQIQAEVNFDSEDINDTLPAIYILIGEVEDQRAKTVFSELCRDDMICKISDGAIVLGGRCDSASVNAVNKFIKEVIPYATPQALMSEEREFFFEHSYELSNMILNDFSIDDFCISYKSGDGVDLREQANTIVDFVASKCGRVLKTYDGDAVLGRRELMLLIDPLAEQSVAYIKNAGEDVVISASTPYGLSIAVREFIKRLEKNVSGGVVSFSLDENISIEFDDVTLPDAAKRYRLVLPANCSDTLALVANSFANSIEEKTGIECEVVYDNEKLPGGDGIVEILIGNTSRDESVLVMRGLRAKDYVCKYSEGSLVIGGLTDNSSINAVARFVTEILPTSSAASIMKQDGGFLYEARYEIQSFTLCGFKISDYTLVCNQESKDFADILQKIILERSGYMLNVRYGNRTSGAKEIVLSIDDLTGGYASIQKDGEDIVIAASDTYGLSLALERFYEILFANSMNGNIAAVVDGNVSVAYNKPAISVITVISRLEAQEGDLAKIIELAGKIKAERPDVIVLADIDENVLSMLKYELGENYSSATATLDCALFYNNETVTLLSGSNTANGNLLLCNTKVRHILSGEEYDLGALRGDGSGKATDIEREMISFLDAAEGVCLFVAPENKDQIPNVEQNGIDTYHNSVLTVRQREYRMVLLCTAAGRVSVKDQETEYNTTADYVLAKFDVDKSFTHWYYDMLKKY